MRFRASRILCVAVLFQAVSFVTPLSAQPVPPGCVAGTLPSHALSLFCVPPAWNGQLVVFAPGYTAPQLPLGFYQLTTPDGVSLPALVGSFGYAFATTSYRQNGLAVLEGIDDVRELVAAFSTAYGTPSRTHLTAVSYGSLVATLLAERYPAEFHSTLAACGPIGSFRGQVTVLGDFRVLFDYFYPNTIPGSPIDIPPAVIANWNTIYVPLITAKLAANPARAVELLRVARAPFDAADPTTIVRTALNLLWYNVFGTNDAKAKLGPPTGHGACRASVPGVRPPAFALLRGRAAAAGAQRHRPTPAHPGPTPPPARPTPALRRHQTPRRPHPQVPPAQNSTPAAAVHRSWRQARA